MNSKDRREYPYRQSWWVIVLGGLFFGACSVFMALEAAGNTRGLVINHVIELSPRSASLFYGVLAVASGLFVIAVLLSMAVRLSRPPSVILDGDALVMPKSGLSRTVVRIPYSEIKSVEAMTVMEEVFMRIQVRDGRRRDLAQSLLPDQEAFQEVLETLQERAGLVPPGARP